ncbi:MAG: hypothetical protein QW607_06240 [Desulfurococcaceae archaeon]
MAERTIGEILEFKGIVRERVLLKWLRWLKDLVPKHEDPLKYYGYYLNTTEDVEKILKKYCEPRLTESECYKVIRSEVLKIKSQTLPKLADPRYRELIEKQALLIQRAQNILGRYIPGLDPHLANEIIEYYEKKDITGLLEAIKDRLLYLYDYSEEEANKILEQVKERLMSIKPEQVYRKLEEALERPEDIYPWYSTWKKLFGHMHTQIDKLLNQIQHALYSREPLERIIKTAKISEVELFKKHGITDPTELYTALTESKLAQALGIKPPTIVRDPYLMRYRYGETAKLYYVVDPLLCFVGTKNNVILYCNQWIFIIERDVDPLTWRVYII